MKPLRIFGLLIVLALLCTVQALAADTTPPMESAITVHNNQTGTPDEVIVDGLMADDIVKVYGAATNPVPVGVTVATGTSATVYVSQLGTEAGSVYVTVTRSPNTESVRTQKTYGAELRTPAPTNITVQNNVLGTPDVITVEDVIENDVVRVYQNAVGNVVLATTKVTGAGNTTARLYVNQLGVNNGTIYVTVQSPNSLESLRTAAAYTTELSQPPAAGIFEITIKFYKEDAGGQIAGTEDLVLVKGLEAGDRVRLYKNTSPSAGLWADETAGADGDLEIRISQLPPNGGVLYATITKPGKAESKPTAVRFGAEPVTSPPPKNITVANNYGTDPDLVTCVNVPDGYIVRVYKMEKDLAPIAVETSPADGATVTLTLSGEHLSKNGGRIYVTYTAPDRNESSKIAVNYNAEQLTQKLRADDITVVNNYGTANDEVTVDGLDVGYIVRIYDSQTGGRLLAEGTAAGPSLEFTGVTWLLPAGGRIYVSVQSGVAHESARLAKSYESEAFTSAPKANTVTVENNYNKPDKVTVAGLNEGDTVRIYSAAKGGELLGSGTAGSAGTATVSIDAGKLLAGGGKIYVTVTMPNTNESARTAVSYSPEPKALPLSTAVIRVENYIGTDNDALTVTGGLNPTDVVTVYASSTGKQKLAFASPGMGQDSVRIPLTTLSAAGGKLFVTVTTENEGESVMTPVQYESEKSSPLTAGPTGVSIVNNYPPAQDVVTVRNLKQGDLITIYRAASGASFIGPLEANNDGDMDIYIDQLGVNAGRIYITITTANKQESARVPIPYPEEKKTDPLLPSAIEVQNNYQMDDTITVTGITVGHTVSVYTTATGVPAIAQTVATVSTVNFTIDNGILAATGGKVFVTVKDPNMHESNRTPQTYTSEVSAAPSANRILVVNYPGEYQDTVTIIGLSPGDTVTVYGQSSGDEILAQETVVGRGTTVTLTAKLQDKGGTIYVTVRGAGKAESKRTPVKYDAQ